MQFSIFSKQFTIDTMNGVPQGGSVKFFNGSGLSTLKIPNSIYFQAPDKIAAAAPENIDQFGLLINTFPVTTELYILSIFLIKCIWNGKLVDQFSEPYI